MQDLPPASQGLDPANSSAARPTVIMVPQVQDQDDEIDLLLLMNVLWAARKRIVGTCLAVAVFTAFGSLLMTSVYTANVLMKPAASNDTNPLKAKLAAQFGGLAAMSGIDLGGETTVGQAIATLESRNFIQSFVKDNRLLPVLFYERWDADTKRFEKPNVVRLGVIEAKAWLTGEELDIGKLGQPTLWDAHQLFIKDILKISENEDVGTVDLAVTWHDPEVAAQWANAMVLRFNQQVRQDDAAEAKRSIEYLKNEIEKTNLVSLRESLYHLIEAQTQKAMLTNIREDYVFKVIDPALAPQEKSAPKRSLIVVLATLLTFLVCAFWTLFTNRQTLYAKAMTETPDT